MKNKISEKKMIDSRVQKIDETINLLLDELNIKSSIAEDNDIINNIMNRLEIFSKAYGKKSLLWLASPNIGGDTIYRGSGLPCQTEIVPFLTLKLISFYVFPNI